MSFQNSNLAANLEDAQNLSIMSGNLPNQIANDQGVIQVPALLGQTCNFQTLQENNFMSLRNSKNESRGTK